MVRSFGFGEVAIPCRLCDSALRRGFVRSLMAFFVVFGLSPGAKALVYQGLTNTSLGNASVAVVCCVSNLSSSGQDGVSLALPTYLTALEVN